MDINRIEPNPTTVRQLSRIMFIVLLVIYTHLEAIFTPDAAFTYAQTPTRIKDSGEGIEQQAGSCIPSGDHTSIQNALTSVGAEAVLCPGAVFELGESVRLTADRQAIYTEGYPTDDTRALLRVVGRDETAVRAEDYSHLTLSHVIIDGNRPALGIAVGALIEWGAAGTGNTVEWVKAYEPRGWSVLYLGEGHLHGCDSTVARYNELGPAGRAEYMIADGISLGCKNSIVENNTIVDVTDGGIVIFEARGSRIANNTIRAENRIMFYGISMEDYGNFTGTKVTGNVIDAAGAMIRRGIGMGPLVGCAHPETDTLRSRGAVVTGNTLMGDHMTYGFVIGGVEDWTVTGNVDLSTHLTPIMVGDCQGTPADPPAGFQYDPRTSSGTFQPEFEAAVLAGSTDMWPLQTTVSESCVAELIGEALLEDIKAGNQGPVWEALESAPNGERIDQCMSLYQPPDVSDLPGDVGVQLNPCEPYCAELRMFNLSDSTADLRGAVFFQEFFPVPCVGMPDSLAPWEETNCIIDDFVSDGYNILQWYGFQPDYGFWGYAYPFETTAVTPEEPQTPATKRFHLFQNYPNPFNPSTTIDYTIPGGASVRVHIKIYDLRGRLTRTLVDADTQPGRYKVRWDGRDNRGQGVSSGMYFYRIEAGDFTSSRKMLLLR